MSPPMIQPAEPLLEVVNERLVQNRTDKRDQGTSGWVYPRDFNICDSRPFGTFFQLCGGSITAVDFKFVVARSTLRICCKWKLPRLASLDRSTWEFRRLLRHYLADRRSLAEVPSNRETAIRVTVWCTA